MKKYLFQFALVLLAACCTTSLFAQDWVKMMQDPNVNFYESQKVFNQYVEKYKANYMQKTGTTPVRVPGYKQFKRWEWFMAPRVSSTGERFAPDAVWRAINDYHSKYQSAGAGNWTFIGPSYSSTLAGAGRLNFIRIHPTNPNTIYVGSPSGGLWISTNGGSSWASNTDKLNQVIGCSDVAFDPNDPSIMYMSTGDVDAGDNYSVGLLKSTDGAATWNTTGLSYNSSQYKQVGKVLVNPNNGNTIIVATTGGIYRSTDAAITFTQVQSGSFKDMEFKPANPSTMYACGDQFYKSTDTGATWTRITSGVPDTSQVERMAIAVTAASPNTVYLVAMKPTTYDMKGVYKSTNSGSGFSYLSAPNIGNQGWFDLCIAASPTNSLEIMLGGQTQFLKSTNGGTNWTDVGGFTHVDYHDVIYTSGTTCYLVSDGGVWKSTNNGGSWSNLNNNLAIAQMYGFGQSTTNPNLSIQGWQDNGTNIYDGTWGIAMGGDGMLAFISSGDDNYMWGSQYNGSLNRSVNGGNSWTPCASISEECPWVTPWNEDPTIPNQIYAGCENIWVSFNGGQNWTNSGNVNGSSTDPITAIGVSPANNLVIWTAKGKILYNSFDGGSTWTAITVLPSGTITGIACHLTNENKAWVTYSAFNSKNKVFQTNDMGVSWLNLSPSLPNIPVNCIAVDKNGKDALYVGTDAGVFFKDSTMSVWQPFLNGLPNVVVTQLNIFYTGGKIRASTYGRGMWESTMYQPGAYLPDANFAGNNIIGCPGLGVQFSDYSSGLPTSWNWTFTGGSPTTSTERNPFVGYNSSGSYSVSLMVSNAIGVDSQTFVNYISVGTTPNAPPATSSEKIFCSSDGLVTLTATPSGSGTIRWWDQFAGGNILATGNTYTPNLSNPTDTFYADEAAPSGNQDSAGPPDKLFGGGFSFTNNDIRGLFFDVLEPVVINSFNVYAGSSGDRTIEIQDGQGNLFYSATVYIPYSLNVPYTVNVDIPVYAGNNYFIKFTGLVDCFRNSTGAVYPYTSSAVNITNSNAGTPGYYYFFYKWKYTKLQCNSGRTPSIVMDTCFTGIKELVANNSIEIYPNPSSGDFTVSMFGNNESVHIELFNVIGQKVYGSTVEKNIHKLKITTNNLSGGIYYLKATSSRILVQKKLSLVR